MSSTQPPLDRRRFLTIAGVTFVAVAGAGLTPISAFAAETLGDAMKEKIGSKTPREGRIELDLPQIAENGNTVPMKLLVDSPMTDTDYVKAVHILADGNPRPGVATFRFSPMNGEASVSTRMRLAKTQNIVALAEMSDGSVYMAKSEVKVTIGGCGG